VIAPEFLRRIVRRSARAEPCLASLAAMKRKNCPRIRLLEFLHLLGKIAGERRCSRDAAYGVLLRSPAGNVVYSEFGEESLPLVLRPGARLDSLRVEFRTAEGMTLPDSALGPDARLELAASDPEVVTAGPLPGRPFCIWIESGGGG